ncbi:F-box and associated interaction domains-containing protein [Striga asiatica]|uniref:F-box and associated interaction domains-containing protein n=1 Tax=Striga asiatica TaxID=4170 RepID=A0A5A7Q6P6_STRAF|nr:F-box and associated interaction domains-containing protein [Striga asiatica]
MLFQECFNFFKRSIRCDSSSSSSSSSSFSSPDVVKKESCQLIFGYEVGLHKETKFCTIDVKSKRIRTVTGIRGKVIPKESASNKVIVSDQEDSMEVGNSCNGLILILYSKKHLLFDPLSNKIVAGTRRLPEWGGRCCGLFYHPLAKEYRLLLVKEIGDFRKEYHIYEFGSQKWRTTLSPYFAYRPVTCAPTVTKKVMCWFDPLSPYTSVLVFDINTENLCSEALPPTAQNLCVPKLVAKGGEDLCCCYVRYAETVVDVWVLVDYTDWLWERKYAVCREFRLGKESVPLGSMERPCSSCNACHESCEHSR